MIGKKVPTFGTTEVDSDKETIFNNLLENLKSGDAFKQRREKNQ
jgi:hypothetical protein